MAADKQNLQDAFLNHVRKTKVPVTIFLINGVKLQGVITWFDNFCVLLRRDGQSQLVYKHAISTIMPGQPVDASQFASQNSNARQRLLQVQLDDGRTLQYSGIGEDTWRRFSSSGSAW